jgi:hypothetical protein
MINNEQKKVIIDNMTNLLELPDSAYDKAQKRYEDLGKWFDREESAVSSYSPYIFPQGSFRIGTAIRPLDEREEYDLDLACKLQVGIKKENHTQETLKKLVGTELEAYRGARNIAKKLESKHRCWRLEYQDLISFHMDIVPCIPADTVSRKAILESIRKTGLDESITKATSQTTVSITDDRHVSYKYICDNWNISNPEGYAKWFEYRIKTQQSNTVLGKAQIESIPVFKRKTPLQRVVQLLKRHRDNWGIGNPESKPISIIITTLAARAYNGETDIVVAIENVLEKMDKMINPYKPRIPNPINPAEDFADRWYRPDSLHLKLEDNFYAWLLQARKDFQHITSSLDINFLYEQLEDKFSLQINKAELKKQLGINSSLINNFTPKTHNINRQESAKPWKK